MENLRVAAKPFKVSSIEFLEGKIVPMRAAGGGRKLFSEGGPSLGSSSAILEVQLVCYNPVFSVVLCKYEGT